jgi:hypothetical protein
MQTSRGQVMFSGVDGGVKSSDIDDQFEIIKMG